MTKTIGATVLLAMFLAAVAGCATGTPVYTINCGAEEDYVDARGRKWTADKDMKIDGTTVVRSLETIRGTPAPKVYLTERYSMTAYKFKVKPGRYTVRLHFAETYDAIMGAGDRLFDVSINSKVVIKNLDVFKEAGGANKPLIRVFRGIEVTGEELAIGFTANVQNPEINGIEILLAE